jgi:hypothetical protein
MSQESSQDSPSQSDQESENDNSIETQSIYDGPYESCLTCHNEIMTDSCFCFECYAELALRIQILNDEQNEDENME